MTRRGQTHVVTGVDIGGTKIKAALVEVSSTAPHGSDVRVLSARQILTPRQAPPAFYATVTQLIRHVQAPHRDQTEGVFVPLVAVAHPGRFLPDGTLARGTTPNLGMSPGQFDGVNPAHLLAARLGMAVHAENDAVAQLRFGVHVLLRRPDVRPQLLGQTVVYLGPGTGMGGGVARVSPDGEVTVITDGHFFDMQVPGYGDGTVTAEELLTGSAIARLVAEAKTRIRPPITPATAQQVSRLLADPEALPAHRAEARRIADLQGDCLALLIEAIHAGRVTKVRLAPSPDGTVARYVDEPDRAWPERDKAAVRGVRRFLLGGSVGTDPALGGHIRRRALERLSQRGLTDMAVVQIPGRSADAGLLGAVMGLPAPGAPPRLRGHGLRPWGRGPVGLHWQNGRIVSILLPHW